MKFHSIIRWLNNNLLPISYSLWKENKDEVYKKLNEKYKPDWVNAQVNIYSGLIIPMIILIIGFFISKEKLPLIFILFVLYFLLVTFLNIKYYDKYVDEKFLDLSKNVEAKKGSIKLKRK